jgi:hypothetical protein
VDPAAEEARPRPPVATSKLAQDPNEARDDDALEQCLGLLPCTYPGSFLPHTSRRRRCTAVEVGVPQADLIPHLELDECGGLEEEEE